MAAVAGHVDDLAGRRQPVEVLGVPHLDAVVYPRQEAAEDALGDPDERVRVVRGDLERVLARDEEPVSPSALRVADLLAHRLAVYTDAAVDDVRYFTFLPDFLPQGIVRLLMPIERLLEASRLGVYSAHYMAVVRKKG